MKYRFALFSHYKLPLMVVLFLTMATHMSAQLPEKFFKSDTKINPANKDALFLEIDNMNFFKDNEYAGPFQKGYTLPGFWAVAKAVYYPLSNIKLEGGIYGIRYWGANRYPNMAYIDIAKWKGDQYLKGFHLLPWIRAQIDLSDKVSFVFGDIYGGSNHNLILPLYEPELNFTADPEMGLQFLLNSSRFKLDIWVNWESFIYRGDNHQEAFTVGASGNFKWNNSSNKVHLYSPVQFLAQHRGGEIDTIYSHSVQTLMNGAVGIGSTFNINHSCLKRINFELDLTAYYQQAGELWRYTKGLGIYGSAYADVKDFRFSAGYWWCHDFISMFGSPFFGAVSTSNPGLVFSNPSFLNASVQYARTFGESYTFGGAINVYQQFKTYKESTSDKGSVGMNTNFAATLFFRVNPSFLLKKFK